MPFPNPGVDPLQALWQGATFFWLGYAAWIFLALISYRRLKSDGAGVPQVDIVIPARNEANFIARTVAAAMGSGNVIVVEDGSVDDTAAKAHAAGATVLHPEARPANWIGKSWAAQAGAAAGTNDWILFLDADVELQPNTVAKAANAAQQAGADLLILHGGQRSNTLGGAIAHLLIGQGIAIVQAPWAVRLGLLPAGVGHFQLIKRVTYEAIGGHSKIAGEVLDDVGLGSLVRAAKGKTVVFDGRNDITGTWSDGIADTMNAMTKNAFAGFGYRLWLAVAAIVAVAHVWFTGVFGWFLPGWAQGASLAFLVYGGVCLFQSYWSRGWGVQHRKHQLLAGLLAPLFFWMYGALLLQSTIATIRHGIQWRGQNYKVADLRRK